MRGPSATPPFAGDKMNRESCVRTSPRPPRLVIHSRFRRKDMQFRQLRVQCVSPAGLHRMAYTEWGARDNPRVLVCVHGLTRNGRDFDMLAQALAADFRVVCPDVVGRGRSGRLRDPSGYAIPQYVADMVTLIARLDVDSVDWLGTSMGGMIGMALAAQDDTPVRRLLLNDVGPVITSESLERIATYVGTDPTWATFDEAQAYIQVIGAPFGQLDEVQWRHLTEYAVGQRPDGRWGFVYDPLIAANRSRPRLPASRNRPVAGVRAHRSVRRWSCAAPNPTC
jgi:pimeloyl-ACP methyl ester carboxylesterase